VYCQKNLEEQKVKITKSCAGFWPMPLASAVD